MKLLKQLWVRWQAKTPRIYLILFRISGSFAAAQLAIMALPFIPDTLKEWAGWAAGVSTALAAFFKAQIETPQQTKDS